MSYNNVFIFWAPADALIHRDNYPLFLLGSSVNEKQVMILNHSLRGPTPPHLENGSDKLQKYIGYYRYI